MDISSQKLAEENHSLIYSFLQKHHLSIEDYYDIAAIGYCKAVNTYNGNFLFSTYAYRCMSNEVKQQYRKNTRRTAIPLEKLVYGDAKIQNGEDKELTLFHCIPDKNVNVEGEILSKENVKAVIKGLKPNEKKALILRLNGLSQQDIANAMGLSQAQIHRYLKNIEKYIIS